MLLMDKQRCMQKQGHTPRSHPCGAWDGQGVSEDAGPGSWAEDGAGCLFQLLGSLVRYPLLTLTHGSSRHVAGPSFHLDVHSRPLPVRGHLVSLLHPGSPRGFPGGGWVVSNSGVLPGTWHSEFGTPQDRQVTVGHGER